MLKFKTLLAGGAALCLASSPALADYAPPAATAKTVVQMQQFDASGNAVATGLSNGSTGSTTPTTATLVGGDNAGNLKALTLDASGRPTVNVNGVVSTTSAPSAASGAGVAPVVSSALEACHVFKASPGNLYGFTVNTSASATANDWILLFNATSAPVDGAVTPVEWARISATTTFGYAAPSGAPLYFSTGIVACLSTTGPTTKTAEAQAVFSGKVQ